MNYYNSEKYKSKIHKLIPGGAHTYTKGDDQFPKLAPAAISHGKGAWVWDIDDNKFLDCSMGLSSVSLGHAYPDVIKRVNEELIKGVNFQRPSLIELEMAEKFLSLVPQHEMIKFSKNGSVITTAAVKLARAYTNRKLIAFPKDHPFYSYDDWFIGKTDCNRGVPNEISELSVTFESDNLESLKNLFERYPNQIAGVISEPEKFKPLPKNYLNDAINFVQSNGAIYILDEMVTGFKTDSPGSISKYNVKPDIATWGKGIANGFSFCCMTGTKEIMGIGGIINEGNEKVFLSSTTHGGETHAIAAGLATIKAFEENNIIEHNHKVGKEIIDNCKDIIHKNSLDNFISIIGDVWFPVFLFKNKKLEIDAYFRTLFLQEMIKNKILFQGVFIPCFSHNEAEVDYFIKGFIKSCKVYKNALDNGVEKFLIGPPIKPVFRKFI